MSTPVLPSAAPDEGASRGFVYALLSYLLWGILPLYMKAVAHISAVEVLAHRILWSVPIAVAVLYVTGRTADIRAAMQSPRTLLMALLTATIIAVNWGIYVWAIAANHTVEAALGYYINPLVTVMLGALLLGERLDRFQSAAVVLAFAAVLLLSIQSGGVPWVSLALAFTFAAYGYLRKTLPIGPAQGFFLEVAILTPPALLFMLWLLWSGNGMFITSGPTDFWLLLAAGPATAVPLLFYAFGAKLLRISTIGMMQYVSPTIVALLAVFAFNEPFGWDRAVAFALIWIALGLYSFSLLHRHRRNVTSGR